MALRTLQFLTIFLVLVYRERGNPEVSSRESWELLESADVDERLSLEARYQEIPGDNVATTADRGDIHGPRQLHCGACLARYV